MSYRIGYLTLSFWTLKNTRFLFRGKILLCVRHSPVLEVDLAKYSAKGHSQSKYLFLCASQKGNKSLLKRLLHQCLKGNL